MRWMKISGLTFVATIGMHAPAAAQAPLGSDAPSSASDSLLTAERLAHYMAVRRALPPYWNSHSDLLHTAQSTAHRFVVSLPGGQLPVGSFDYPALVKQDTALAAIFSINQFAPTEFAPTQISVNEALGLLAYHAAQGTALPASPTVRGKNIQLVQQYLMELATAGVSAPPVPAPACKEGSPASLVNGATTVTPHTSGANMAGIPSQPNDVTVIPFYTKPDETPLEQTKAVIEAEIDGHRGVFIFDLGAGTAILNRTFLQPNAKGGVDTVTDANRIHDNTPRSDYINSAEQKRQLDHVHVTVRLGTLVSNYDDPALTVFMDERDPHRYNAELGHLWGNFGWVFGPRLGNLGPAVFQPFETIVDYTHRRIVLIRLDSTGRRVVDVPAYTPRTQMPLLSESRPAGFTALRIAVGPCDSLDTSDLSRNLWIKILDTGAPDNAEDFLGYPFFSHLGVFGVNQRTHQFILYRTGGA
jgi:hypothetical protein